MHFLIKEELQKSQELIAAIQTNEALLRTADAIARCCVDSLQKGGKILFAGNGGSAADSQHLAAELVCRLSYDRPAMAALALTTDTSALTAISNDYSFDYLFARQVEAIGQAGDVLIGISTSGKSPNILRALEVARIKGLVTIGFTGPILSLLTERCDLVLNIPSRETPKIQEGHILFGHIICAVMEEILYGADYHPARKAALRENFS